MFLLLFLSLFFLLPAEISRPSPDKSALGQAAINPKDSSLFRNCSTPTYSSICSFPSPIVSKFAITCRRKIHFRSHLERVLELVQTEFAVVILVKHSKGAFCDLRAFICLLQLAMAFRTKTAIEFDCCGKHTGTVVDVLMLVLSAIIS